MAFSITYRASDCNAIFFGRSAIKIKFPVSSGLIQKNLDRSDWFCSMPPVIVGLFFGIVFGRFGETFASCALLQPMKAGAAKLSPICSKKKDLDQEFRRMASFASKMSAGSKID